MGTPFIIKGYDFTYICFKDKEHDNDKSVTTKGDLTNMHACANNTNKSHCGLVRLFY